MSSFVGWVKKKVKAATSPGERNSTTEQGGAHEYEEFISEKDRKKARKVRKAELLELLQMESDCMASLRQIRNSLQQKQVDRKNIIAQQEKCRRALEQYSGADDADKRAQIDEILNRDLPQALSIIDMSINKLEMNIQKVDQDMKNLGQQRRELFVKYCKTFKKGEEPDMSEFDRFDPVEDGDELEGEDGEDLEIS